MVNDFVITKFDAKYFKYAEFDSPDLPESGMFMDRALIKELDMIRTCYGKPIIPNSGFRTLYRNTEINGDPNSSHLVGHAVDIPCTNSADRSSLLSIIITATRINRIGIYKAHLHLDNDPTKPPHVFWLG